uniref:methylmalonyl-CoA mutase family protein n=1 Tax=Vogesella mureinivorans TaxID=657276 RepID=UPI001F0FC22F
MSLPDFTTLTFDQTGTSAHGPGPAKADGWTTPEKITVDPAYGPDAVEGLDFVSGLPGVAPYLRGPYPSMYATNPWTIRQYAGFSTAEA